MNDNRADKASESFNEHLWYYIRTHLALQGRANLQNAIIYALKCAGDTLMSTEAASEI